MLLVSSVEFIQLVSGAYYGFLRKSVVFLDHFIVSQRLQLSQCLSHHWVWSSSLILILLHPDAFNSRFGFPTPALALPAQGHHPRSVASSKTPVYRSNSCGAPPRWTYTSTKIVIAWGSGIGSPLFAKHFQVIDHALPNQVLRLAQGVTGGNAAAQVRQIGRVAIVAFLDYDSVFQSNRSCRLPPAHQVRKICAARTSPGFRLSPE